jgi:hypothetical protein
MEVLKGFTILIPEKLNLVAATSDSISQIFFDSYFTNTTVADSNSTQLFNLLSTASIQVFRMLLTILVEMEMRLLSMNY